VVLRRAAIQPIPLVRRGSTVTLVVVSGGFKITNRGVARRDGARGETVAVFCQGSGRTIRARVVARQRLRVDL
ncbi:MAG: flagellar basal body P-ring formation protein FlgA, partial [Myxococcales bacterium]|nr:flagellar basal body P-ring formation protein FlgA [Myxococcales bacterium]